tara:strand:+ start:1262 stop:1663 length:402 start_codon:yes stop_codon:yes gene_type:complete
MAIVNARGLLANESWHRLDCMPLVSDRDRFGADFYVNFLTDQATGDRVGVGANVDRRTLTNTDALLPIIGVESVVRQTLKYQLFLGKSPLARRVGAVDDLLNECHIIFAAGEVAVAAKQQCSASAERLAKSVC